MEVSRSKSFMNNIFFFHTLLGGVSNFHGPALDAFFLYTHTSLPGQHVFLLILVC